MKKVYLVYSADAWLMEDSRQLFKVCESFENCIKAIKESIEKEKEPELSENDIYNLENMRQTQGRENNFIIEEWKVN